MTDLEKAVAEWRDARKAFFAVPPVSGDDPSLTIQQAIHGGCELLKVQCRSCNHAEFIDLTEVVWPRDRPVHTLRKALYCRPCRQTRRVKVRPDLVGLKARPEDEPSTPARSKKAR